MAPGDDVEERLRALGTQSGAQRWDTLPAPPEAHAAGLAVLAPA